MLQHIEYAKLKSYATMKREDPNFLPPTSLHAQNTATRLGNGVLGAGDKRSRDQMDEDEHDAKKERTDDDDEGEEMEIDDEEETGTKGKGSSAYDHE